MHAPIAIHSLERTFRITDRPSCVFRRQAVPMIEIPTSSGAVLELVRPVAEGGMGVVYRGRHRRDGTSVAVKIMTSELARQSEYKKEFRREVQAMAKLYHPAIAHVVSVYPWITATSSVPKRSAMYAGRHANDPPIQLTIRNRKPAKTHTLLICGITTSASA